MCEPQLPAIISGAPPRPLVANSWSASRELSDRSTLSTRFIHRCLTLFAFTEAFVRACSRSLYLARQSLWMALWPLPSSSSSGPPKSDSSSWAISSALTCESTSSSSVKSEPIQPDVGLAKSAEPWSLVRFFGDPKGRVTSAKAWTTGATPAAAASACFSSAISCFRSSFRSLAMSPRPRPPTLWNSKALQMPSGTSLGFSSSVPSPPSSVAS
mmetsp:Transcript_103435/g.267526  ORF Transcript_103435/g.267526 Transcript_103435/m.267526 type:complete len:213 (+) Transcript_103435:46-684(+)